MKTILTVAKREITRLKSRFSGKSRAVVLGVLVLAIAGSFVLYHQDLVISKGLYTIGVGPNSPSIEDSRFIVREMDRDTGYRLLDNEEIDLYLDGTSIFSNHTERADYAVAALTKYLEKQDLLRIAGEYDIDDAFPLRIRVSYADTATNELIAAAVAAEAADEGPEATETVPAPAVTEEIPAATVPAESAITEAVPPEMAIESITAYVPPPGPTAEPTATEPAVQPATTAAADDPTDEAVLAQLEEFNGSGSLPEFKAEFVSENDIIIPSLMNPPIPLAQVIITFLYVVPVFFISLFFTSSFTEEKVSRKLIVLLSAPVTRLQVIIGKMLPYLVYSIIVIIGVTLALRGNVGLALAIFIPVMLFIFAIYLIVALTYRTFKDQTFFSVLALSVVTIYLVGPAMFTGVNDLSYISPLTLAVEMYRGESFEVSQYFMAATPLFLVFGSTMYAGTRVLNEEFLMGFRPLHRKVVEAIYMTLDRAHLNISMFLMNMAFVPVVFMVQMAAFAIVSNLPVSFMLALMLIVAVVVEEIAKSFAIFVLVQYNALHGWRNVLRLSAISALGFVFMEKLLLYVALSVVDDSVFMQALSGGGLLVLPMLLHIVSTSLVCIITARFGTKWYPLGLVAGSLVHLTYNLFVTGLVA